MNTELQVLTERVATLEQTVAQFTPHKEHWLDRFRRGVTDVQALDEALRLGREFRDSYVEQAQSGSQS